VREFGKLDHIVLNALAFVCLTGNGLRLTEDLVHAAFFRNQKPHSGVEVAFVLPKERHLLNQVGEDEPDGVRRLQAHLITLVVQAKAQSTRAMRAKGFDR
jgi:hypothetical protein